MTNEMLFSGVGVKIWNRILQILKKKKPLKEDSNIDVDTIIVKMRREFSCPLFL